MGKGKVRPSASNYWRETPRIIFRYQRRRGYLKCQRGSIGQLLWARGSLKQCWLQKVAVFYSNKALESQLYCLSNENCYLSCWPVPSEFNPSDAQLEEAARWISNFWNDDGFIGATQGFPITKDIIVDWLLDCLQRRNATAQNIFWKLSLCTWSSKKSTGKEK